MPKYRRACDECQRRHLKCDFNFPCRPCSVASRCCVEAIKYVFRHEENPSVQPQGKQCSMLFDDKQVWVDLPSSRMFIKSMSSISLTVSVQFVKERVHESYITLETTAPCLSSETGEISFENLSSSEDAPSYPTVQSPDQLSREVAAPVSIVLSPHECSHLSVTSPKKPKTVLWPGTKAESKLMQYFATELSVWFDYLAQYRHFSTVVIQAAATSPALYYAILAISLKHLSLVQNYDRYIPDKYHQECLNILIPTLEDPDILLDETLFAATVILRLLDEMTVKDQPETEQHVLGSHMLVDARQRTRTHPSTAPNTSLRYATSIIELRQEIHIAIMMNRQPSQFVQYGSVDRSLSETDDWTWTHRILAHIADVLTYCNGPCKTLERLNELFDYLRMWEAAIPPSFTPLYEEQADPENGMVFPEVLFANDCHVAGHQFVAMSRILLLAQDPAIPPLGPERIKILKKRDASFPVPLCSNTADTRTQIEIKEQVLRICGIATSNRHFTPCLFAAGAAVSMCGERFAELDEQKAFLHILEITEAHVGWQSLRASDRQRECWGWDPS
ncbi:hypothetical protein HYALB_00013750 [Hymenoscyphus albidus]|uniref:Zn(2)-C6 fungal-type domain-containing protein n=1 Tax=Hymenoscyphus albidus TaxID=595503 RepID=A0A9N9LSR5_9HELO|nr:hypothetical protein HYALB_00013750 [Hymenoscyphus albidus]